MQAAAHILPSGHAASLAVAYVDAGAREPGWSDALTWAHRDQLPLLLVCHDATQGRAPRKASRTALAPITWPAVSRLARKLHLPLFPIDGDDAVAVFRVMQEAAARARDHGGPSILWAVHNTSRLPRQQQPLGRLEAYLAARGISLQG
jgi:pyruvate dehydrogenase E1 component alpha subunit